MKFYIHIPQLLMDLGSYLLSKRMAMIHIYIFKFEKNRIQIIIISLA